MKKLLLVAGVVVAAVAGVYFFYLAPRLSRKAARNEHRKSIEAQLAPLTAMMKAPDGATPCETAYNAFAAYDQAARAGGLARPWLELPERGKFLARCGGLSQKEQLCLQPRHAARAHEECDPLLEQIKAKNVLYEPVTQAAGPSGHTP